MDNSQQDVSEHIQVGSGNDMSATVQLECDPPRKEKMDNNNQDVSENSQVGLSTESTYTAQVGSVQSVKNKI